MKSQAEKLKSEQCRRILEALESGPKTTGELVKLCKLTAGSIESTLMSWLRQR
jgi:predicted transcriptional regulator